MPEFINIAASRTARDDVTN